MPRVGFEDTITVFKLAETVHALDRAAIVIGSFFTTSIKLIISLHSKFKKLKS
jgi:hypothetical protein